MLFVFDLVRLRVLYSTSSSTSSIVREQMHAAAALQQGPPGRLQVFFHFHSDLVRAHHLQHTALLDRSYANGASATFNRHVPFVSRRVERSELQAVQGGLPVREQ